MMRSTVLALVLGLALACAAQGTASQDSVPVVPAIDDRELDDLAPVEVPAVFPGGAEALAAFMVGEVKYPKKARRAGVQGQVIVGFVVNETGAVTDVQVVKGLDPLLDAEAVRAVQAMPKWAPGTLNGRPVKVRYNLPVRFMLQD